MKVKSIEKVVRFQWIVRALAIYESDSLEQEHVVIFLPPTNESQVLTTKHGIVLVLKKIFKLYLPVCLQPEITRSSCRSCLSVAEWISSATIP